MDGTCARSSAPAARLAISRAVHAQSFWEAGPDAVATDGGVRLENIRMAKSFLKGVIALGCKAVLPNEALYYYVGAAIVPKASKMIHVQPISCNKA